MQRSAIYTRVSDPKQEGNNSLTTQLEASRRYAAHHSFQIVIELQDVMSGATLDRIGLIQVRKLIASREIDVLIVFASDRLTRNLAHLLLLRDELRAAGVVLHCVTKGASQTTPEGDLFTAIDGAFAEYERMKIRERMMRGRRGKVEAGKHPGDHRPSYGFRYEGNGRDRTLVVVKDEALIVRKIFEWYVYEGISANAITDRLTKQRIPTAADLGKAPKRRAGYGEWAGSSVTALLHNPIYKGEYRAYAGRKHIDNDYLTIAVEPLISVALWESAQQKLALGQILSPRNSKHFYLLGRRIKCSCGYSANGVGVTGHQMYRCGAKYNRSTLRQCTMPTFPTKTVDRIVWNWIEEHLNRETILEGVQMQRARSGDRRGELLREREAYVRMCDKIDGQIVGLWEVIENPRDATEREEARERLSLRRTEKQRIEAEIAEIDAKITEDGPTDPQVEALLLYADTLADEVSHIAEDAERRKVIDMLQTRATLVLENGQKFVDLWCVLVVSEDPIRLPIQPSIANDHAGVYV